MEDFEQETDDYSDDAGYDSDDAETESDEEAQGEGNTNTVDNGDRDGEGSYEGSESQRHPVRALLTFRPEAKSAIAYRITPSVAAPQSTSVNAFCATPCMRWRHWFADSSTRAGVLLSYWERGEQKGMVPFAPSFGTWLNLAVQNQRRWLLSRLESGAINFQSVRHDKGKIITILRKHTSAVSVLRLADDERSVLSGGWDGVVYDWDLNTGQPRREFPSWAGQVSSVGFRPISMEWQEIMGTPFINGEPGSPVESTRSFDSLFDDDDEMGMAGEEDEKSRAITNGFGRDLPSDTPADGSSSAMDQNVFQASSMDGTLRIWDIREPNPVAVRTPSKGVPPWCMSSCWSTNGNFIYAGRRNGTVEEFSVHKGIGEATRTLKFRVGGGPVSAVATLPNGRHLICASFDNIRLYDLSENAAKRSAVPFHIIPGHQGGVVSSLYVDATGQYLISNSGNRGWGGITTEALLGYEISSVLS
ncbi:WD40-repeat-containing domain protein [Tuber brumale]|nr:WD40-repeat-containing domain protein [Tuber brumale]